MKRPLLSELTIKQKIGQMLLGFQSDINRKTEISLDILRTQEERIEHLKAREYGTLYAQHGDCNRGRTTDMNEDMHRKRRKSDARNGDEDSAEFGAWLQWQSDLCPIPALTALDAEREGAGTLFWDLTTTCSPLAMGAANDEKLAYELGVQIAKELRTAGVNWRWTPVVDTSPRYSANAHMLRVYAPDNVEKQVRLASAHALGMQSQGVAATAKHFPGEDKTDPRDSHFCSGHLKYKTKEEWFEKQGAMFQGLIDNGVYSVMISHHGFPAVDNSKVKGRYRPATVSKKIVTDLLKGEMGFKGVVITDAVVMAALYTLFDYETMLIELVNAGNDVLLGVRPDAGELLEKAFNEGKISEERIDDAVTRIFDMKEKLGMFEDGYRLVKGKAEDVTPRTREVNMEIARKAVTLIRDRENMLPLKKENIKNVAIIISTHYDGFADDAEVLKKEFEDRGAKVHMQRRLKNNEELDALCAENDLIIYAAYVAGHQPMGGPYLFEEECRTYLSAFSNGREKSIGVSFGYPYIHYDIMEGADTFVNCYGKSPDLMKAFVEGIYGEIEFKGESPVELDEEKW